MNSSSRVSSTPLVGPSIWPVSIQAPILPCYTVRRSSRARRSRLTISETGEAVVVLPARAGQREAQALVERHVSWIERHARRIEERRAALAARPALDAGRRLPLNGIERQVAVITAFDRRARSRVVVTDAGVVLVERASAERLSTAELLEAWLRAEARDVIGHTAARRAHDMGISYSRITIRDQRTRWGSASRNGTLSFSWRLVLAPPEVLDYVVVHELAHLRQAGHGRAFWELIGRHFPGSAEARRWLRDNHDALRHALD